MSQCGMGERRGRQTPSDTTTTSSTCPVAHRVSPKAVLGAKLCPDAVGDGEEVRGGREDEVDDGLGAEEEDGAAAKAFFTLSFFLAVLPQGRDEKSQIFFRKVAKFAKKFFTT